MVATEAYALAGILIATGLISFAKHKDEHGIHGA